MATTLATATAQALPRPRLAFVLLCLARFMVVLDASIVNVALPSMHALPHQNLTRGFTQLAAVGSAEVLLAEFGKGNGP